ncbi:hypothetical protein [Actinomadura sp. CNU-125]|uniref:hypothetical protein n=1 Tax=Actinomadura sp. CNU-125 TaxID=1904961 RepID=UPI000A67A57C|nr:hypothetical protein [Actinomadura sp. CNU-125]
MGRTIAISGTASGIGRTLAGILRDRGDDVIGVDLRDADVCADLGTPEGRDAAVAAVLDRSGGTLDGVVACAGVSGPTPLTVTVNHFGVLALLEGLRPALARAARRAPPPSGRSPGRSRWTTTSCGPAWTATSPRRSRRPRR